MSKITISKDSKLSKLIENAVKQDNIREIDKSRLEIALYGISDTGTIYEEEILLAHEVILSGAANERRQAEPKSVDSSSKAVAKKVTVTRKPEVEKEPVHGERRNFNGTVKRYVAGGQKADGTEYKGYWMKAR